MSRKGNCWESEHCSDAVAQSFFATLKKQIIYGNKFETREQARLEIFEYIEGYYNQVRKHGTLSWLTPNKMVVAALGFAIAKTSLGSTLSLGRRQPHDFVEILYPTNF